MALMISSRTNYDYDTMQPCFFLGAEEEDFYPPPHSQLLPGPGEDIWKKFELLPTPPLSPSRTPPPSDPSLSAVEHLEAVSELLDDDRNAFLQSFIIQDCMWSSSFVAATTLEKVVSERLASLQARRLSSDPSSPTGGAADGEADQTAPYLPDLQAAASNCIDPSVVFPLASASRQQLGAAEVEVGSEPSLETPPLSSSDSESEEEEDGEDEEVDVVTVDRQRMPRRPEVSPLVLKRSHINIQQHNYAAAQPARKRPKMAESPAPSRHSGGRRCWSPRSDAEDEDRRRTHNVLERQRRHELRRSFLGLREQIPAVAHNEKAAKVVILKRATEFIMAVREEERKLLRRKEELTKRSRELRRRLEQLRTLP
ncbi:PREDICTED: transcriptional regulator Myc-B-like [Cyprinodon variegatus]|uniref:MYC proto-oncogene, bHLH transcription factor n=1 Tax=Cyprinodon variegatus TaxID=28743 RepID=A0A3Q2DEK2_CYPVA|nr:PREDICTED: transcriptional regulator Myc-B-like [Cyprinodon variegatus]